MGLRIVKGAVFNSPSRMSLGVEVITTDTRICFFVNLLIWTGGIGVSWDRAKA